MNHLLLKNQFMIPKERSIIYRSETLFRFSFEQEFNADGFICKDNIPNINVIQPDLDKIDSYPILMLDDPKPCQIHPEIIKNSIIDPDLPPVIYFTIPICVFFGNYFIWLYLTKEEYETEFVFKKTNEVYNIPQVGDLYRFVKKSIKDDIGHGIKFDIIPDNKYGIPLFQDENELWDYYVGEEANTKSSKFSLRRTIPAINQINYFNQEFTICQFGKPFYMPYNIDNLETAGKGGTYIQPVQILCVNPEKLGWIGLTASRTRYLMEKII